MSTVREAIDSLLTGDAALMALLTGGVYDTPISRQGTPDAFEGSRGGQLKPCATMRFESTVPAANRLKGFEQSFFAVYVYARQRAVIDRVIKRLKVLLDRETVDLGDDGLIYEVRHADDSGDLVDADLNDTPMRYVRFFAVVQHL